MPMVYHRAGGVCHRIGIGGRFRDLILGSRVAIFCDHNLLQYIRESATKRAKLLRWSIALTEFDLDIKYTKGSENVVADYLSRT